MSSEILLQLAGDVRALREDMSRLPRRIWNTLANGAIDRTSPSQLPRIPQILDKYYTDALEEGKPTSYTSIDEFPLRDGLDALIFHFKEVGFSSIS